MKCIDFIRRNYENVSCIEPGQIVVETITVIKKMNTCELVQVISGSVIS